MSSSLARNAAHAAMFGSSAFRISNSALIPTDCVADQAVHAPPRIIYSFNCADSQGAPAARSAARG